MFTPALPATVAPSDWKSLLARAARLALYVLMTVQFVGCYLYNTFPYVDIHRFTHGYERLPFQTRLLLAPLFRWAEGSAFMVGYASRLARNTYFFPVGIHSPEVLEFYLDILCVLIAGWVAFRLYRASSRQQLLGWLVYPLFMVLCVASYLLHTVQNFRFVYDMPSMAFFALGLYVIYFRKSRILLVALFALATLNRETTLFLIPFFVLSECARGDEGKATLQVVSARSGAPDNPSPLHIQIFCLPRRIAHRLHWRRALAPEVAIPALLMLAYWAVWHHFIFHLFHNNASEYYSRVPFNFYCFRRLRYYPQLFSACAFLLPFLAIYWKHVHDRQLRFWMLMIPFWYAIMAFWGILVETRVFGELIPFLACATTLIAEEVLVATVLSRRLRDEESGGEDDRLRLIDAA